MHFKVNGAYPVPQRGITLRFMPTLIKEEKGWMRSDNIIINIFNLVKIILYLLIRNAKKSQNFFKKILTKI